MNIIIAFSFKFRSKKKAWQKRNPFALLSLGSFLEISKKQAKTQRTFIKLEIFAKVPAKNPLKQAIKL